MRDFGAICILGALFALIIVAASREVPTRDARLLQHADTDGMTFIDKNNLEENETPTQDVVPPPSPQNTSNTDLLAPAPRKPEIPDYTTLLLRFVRWIGMSLVNRERRSEGDQKPPAYLDELVYSMGAALGKQDCWRRSLCHAGTFLARVSNARFLFLALDHWAPQKWSNDINTVKRSSTLETNCAEYKCSVV